MYGRVPSGGGKEGHDDAQGRIRSAQIEIDKSREKAEERRAASEIGKKRIYVLEAGIWRLIALNQFSASDGDGASK
jgi:hypothetical protein